MNMSAIETERLFLSPWTLTVEDVKGLYDYAKNPNVGPNAGWAPHKSEDESANVIKEMFMPYEVWSIRDRETGELMGSIGLEPDRRREGVNSRELGYSLGEEFWGHGYMTEAAKAVMKKAFDELNLDVMSICTGPQNKRSQRVIEKCGFKFEGIQRRGYHIYDGTDRDNLVYSILREEFYAREAAQENDSSGDSDETTEKK